MKKASSTILIAVLAAACVFSGVALNALMRRGELARLDLSKGAITTLDTKTIETLSGLASPVKITYYTTERKRMPTAMRTVESDARALLGEMARRAGKNFTFEVMYPEDNPQVSRSLGRFGITSFQFKSILKDEYSVATIWSGILIEYKGKPRSITYITRGHLRHLEDRIITYIHQIDTGYRPFAAVHASADYTGLRSMINSMVGDVKDFGFKDGGMPLEADVCFIMQPEEMRGRDVNDIKTFLGDGKDVFLCFSNYMLNDDGGGNVRVRAHRSGLEEFLSDIGVRFEKSVVVENKQYKNRPWLIDVQGTQVVLDGFKLLRCGTMSLPFASPISADIPKLKKNGYSADTLIFSSKDSWPLAIAGKETLIPAAEFSRASSHNTKPEAIAVVLTSDKPWEGRLFLFGSGYMFSDQASARGASQLYLKNILMTFVSPDKLGSIHASQEKIPLIGEQSAAARLFWRFTVIFLLPLAGIVVLVFRVLRVRNMLAGLDARPAALLFGGFAVIILFLVTIKAMPGFYIDVTREKVNTLNPVTVRWLQQLREDVTITYVSSPAQDMPVRYKSMVNEVVQKLRRMAAAGNGKIKLFVQTVSPDDTGAQTANKKCVENGIEPFKMRVIENDRYAEKMVYSGLIFETRGNSESVRRLTLQNAGRLEFVAVSALERLAGGRRPSVAMVADLPHLTAGEFWELQQLEVQVMPRSEDVYSRLLAILRNEGYRVNIYDSKADVSFKEDMLLYIQPWVVSDSMKKEFNRLLCAGRPVLLAGQHYKMQARKYSGRAYEISYWPQPQFSRIGELLSPYGIELVNEIFFDQSKAPIDTSEQIRWGAYKKMEKRAPDAQPFIIRAIPSNFDKSSPITSRLSDVLFIWGNRWKTLKDKFPGELSWRPLISSTEDCWAFNWQGGFLTDEILQKGDYFDVNQPLVAMAEGKFPALYGNAPAAVSSRLLLVGSSKLFENEQIDTTQYENEKFILNAVADLCYGSALARIQSGSAPAPGGFPYVPPSQKLMWRLMILALSPAIFIIYACISARR